MSQYFMVINHSIREYIHPHDIGENASFIGLIHGDTVTILAYLLRKSREMGFGDIIKDMEYNGRWAGDRIEILGDYHDQDLFLDIQNDYHNITREAYAEYNLNATIKPQINRTYSEIIPDPEDQV